MKSIRKIFSTQWYVIKLAWRFNKWFLFTRFITAVISGILPTATVFLSKQIVQQLTEKNWNGAVFYILLLAAISLSLSIIVMYIAKKQGTNDSLFRNELFFKVLVKNAEMDMAILDDPKNSTLKEMATAAAQGNYITSLFSGFFGILSTIITLVSTVYILATVEVYLFIVLLCVIILQVLTVLKDKRDSRENFVNSAPINKEVSYYMGILMDSTYSYELRMHGLAKWIEYKYQYLYVKIRNMVLKLNNKMFANNVLRSLISEAQEVFLYLFLAWRMIFAGLSFADFTMFFTALQTFSGTVSSLLNQIIGIADTCRYVDAYIDYMNIPNQIAVDKPDSIRIDKKGTLGDIVFKDVSFKYPGSDYLVLKNVNLQIDNGGFYVIVGVNGAGKTTLVNLILRLYDVTSGEIMFNGKNIKDYNYKDYRDLFGVVFQDYKSFEFSIAENVALDQMNDSAEVKAKIESCLKFTKLLDKVNTLPKKMMTMLGKLFDENGVRLSGGETQKLALAKALFRDPRIVVLDEPTSALDAFAEADLIDTFNQATRGKTVFYISHRLSVAKYADKVIFIDGNTVSGFDTHADLLKTNARYAEMYEAQAKHYTCEASAETE